MTDKKQIEPIITAYLSGNASAEECYALEDWVTQSSKNKRYFEEMRNIWQVMHPTFNPLDIDVSGAEKKMLAHISATKRNWVHVCLLYWQRAAAILLLPLLALCAYLYMNQEDELSDVVEYQEVKSPHGTFSEVRLPDGTQVWLNGGSSLKYPVIFQKGERNVYLSGEGYFEVQSDQENPFIVKTGQLTLRATGTAFNIEAYHGDSVTAVTMVEGQIDVAFGKTSPIVMKPGYRAVFNSQTQQCLIGQTDPYKWYAWKDGLMIFRDDPLSYVFKRLGQTFNVQIDLKDPALATAPYRATFEYESLDEILRLLEMSAPLHFRQNKRVKDKDNSYRKQTIEVYKGKRRL
jgi:ferric-dicitrate binding protein FerR (iron transport regulator)